MRSRGISLIEVVTVISIISISTLVAIPPLLSWKKNAELRGTAAKLTNSLQLARNHALINREYVVTKFNQKNYQIFVDNGDGGAAPGDWARSGDEKMLCSYQHPPGVSISTTFPSERFRFKGFGRNQPGSIVLRGANGSQVRIVVNVLGRIRAEFN